MTFGRTTKIVFRLSAAVIIAILLLISLPLVVCRDHAYICENTGSRKGFRRWYWGTETGQWYKQSSVETFMKQKFPNQLAYRWTSYAGTGRNIFGQRISYGHGRPGSVLQLPQEWLNEWFNALNESEKKFFYDLLVSDDEDAIKNQMHKALEELIDRRANSPQ